jgi:hypothetical protein
MYINTFPLILNALYENNFEHNHYYFIAKTLNLNLFLFKYCIFIHNLS